MNLRIDIIDGMGRRLDWEVGGDKTRRDQVEGIKIRSISRTN